MNEILLKSVKSHVHAWFKQYIFIQRRYEDESIRFSMDRDGHDFHALFQYMFYTWVQNCTLIESFFDKILNVKLG